MILSCGTQDSFMLKITASDLNTGVVYSSYNLRLNQQQKLISRMPKLPKDIHIHGSLFSLITRVHRLFEQKHYIK